MYQQRNRPSRRDFLVGSAAAVGAASLIDSRMAAAQAASAAQNAAYEPAVDLSAGQVVQITMVVNDAEKVAKNFSSVFGPSWRFYEFKPKQVLLHGKTPSSPDCTLKLAIGECGGHSFKLVQPVSGSSAYADFLQQHGEGFYGYGLGVLRNYDAAVTALKNAGVAIDTQAHVGNGAQFTVFDTAGDLGSRIEIASAPMKAESSLLRQTGSYAPQKPSLIDMSAPAVSGGRRFTQVGIVIKDAHKGAQRYEQLFGLRGWKFVSIPVKSATLHGKPLAEKDLPSAEVLQAVAYLGGTQIELLEPVNIKPGGIHREFLDRHGSGFQHLMVTPSAGDYDAAIEAFKKAGMPKANEAVIQIGSRTVKGDYIDMQSQLGGFLLEFPS
jgi:Glyoxalase/Bleomycin resistance protein/Dioxygenase superfamily